MVLKVEIYVILTEIVGREHLPNDRNTSLGTLFPASSSLMMFLFEERAPNNARAPSRPRLFHRRSVKTSMEMIHLFSRMALVFHNFVDMVMVR